MRNQKWVDGVGRNLTNELKDKAIIRSFLFHYAEKINHVVQVGACDGILFDFLYPFMIEYRWPGTLIEPVEESYNKLRENYKFHPNITLLNGALTHFEYQEGMPSTVVIYGNDANPFNYSCVQKDQKVRVVPAWSWEEVLKSGTNLVIIDTEGYDQQLIESLFRIKTPDILIWEQNHQRETMSEFHRYIEDNGYEIVTTPMAYQSNMMAIQKHFL